MTIWVDLICINQVDKEEKSTQLQLMEEIYTWAEMVYLYLGEANGQSNRAMAYLSDRSVMMGLSPLAQLAAISEENKGVKISKFRAKALGDPFHMYTPFPKVGDILLYTLGLRT